MRSDVRESEADESRKMIRALSRYLHAHIRCQQNPHDDARKMRRTCIAMSDVWRRCRAGCALGGARRGEQRIGVARVLLPPRCMHAAGGAMPQPRCGNGTTGRCSGPVYQESGRISRLSAACSSTCAAQPVMREHTKIGVKSGMSKPIR